MMTTLAWSNVRTNPAAYAATFTTILLAVTLVGSSGLLIAGVSDGGELEAVGALVGTSAVISAFVSVFVVSGMLSLHVMRQRRAWGLLRSVGLTPRQVRLLVTVEALVVAAAASAVGCALAVPYAHGVAAVLRRVGFAPTDIPVAITPVPFIVASAVGMVATLAASRIAARKAVRSGPLEVLRDSAAEQRILPWPRALVGTAALAGGVVLLDLASRQTEGGGAMEIILGAVMALCVAASALGTVVVRALGYLLAAPVAWLDPAAGMLARASLATQPRRAASVASPVMLTVALMGTFVFAAATTQTAAGQATMEVGEWIAPALVGSTALYTVISVLNATAMSMSARAQELRLLRSVGIGPAQLTRALVWESLITVAVGALLGTAIAAAGLLTLGRVLTGRLWFDYSAPQYLGLLAVCTAAGLIGALVSTRKARRGPLVG
ncbi:FtsX-like permease family protein [Sinosporangium album]|uniref:FtsX-like permease family protein n=1 Tax=Sinosporangium album TaxID=504805 RepID=A0A1G8LM02_9ACTN|nr:ABC transporter permease [Sinosporangium album]SDI56704.1 FtsX-like permease family protein [Sinosporangium album]